MGHFEKGKWFEDTYYFVAYPRTEEKMGYDSLVSQKYTSRERALVEAKAYSEWTGRFTVVKRNEHGEFIQGFGLKD